MGTVQRMAIVLSLITCCTGAAWAQSTDAPPIDKTAILEPLTYSASKEGVLSTFYVPPVICKKSGGAPLVTLRITNASSEVSSIPTLLSSDSSSAADGQPLRSARLSCGHHVAFMPDSTKSIQHSRGDLFEVAIFVNGDFYSSWTGPIRY
jgi:hypothetical protein